MQKKCLQEILDILNCVLFACMIAIFFTLSIDKLLPSFNLQNNLIMVETLCIA